ncbi:MAG: M36 family metallopeptidase [Deltaproteobacteria bacterium]|nr:M36 family metallopeptidase [Deltaproteobacteria bacterium]
MRLTAFRVALIGAGLISGCATGEPEDSLGQSSAAVGTTPVERVKNELRARGKGWAVDRLNLKSEHFVGHSGATQIRMEQVIDGLRVHGSYVRASVTPQGVIRVLHERLAPQVGNLPTPNITPRNVLAAVLADLGYEPATLGTSSGAQGNVTRFARGTTFHRDPSVERVAYLDDVGAAKSGFLVETWSVYRNQLDHTVVDAQGNVVSVESRTNTDRYNVFAEDPIKTEQAPIFGPGAGNPESPSGWLAGTQGTQLIQGNNVRAYLDKDNNNVADTGGTAVLDGEFLAAANLITNPGAGDNLAVSTQNLFYLNNIAHDVLYRAGFDEAQGNFQTNNFSAGGLGNDRVNAEAQDGGGTDNANFATPTDGSSPRMQMYLWSGTGPNAFVTTVLPSAVQYGAWSSSFGTQLTDAATATSSVVVVNDGVAAAGGGTVTDGCERIVGSLSGKLAIIDRGYCDFTVKVLNAQNAGAVGVIVVNNVPGDNGMSMGGTNRKITIRSVMVGNTSGNALKATAGATANMRKNPSPSLMIDASLDSDIVFHEFGHGLTWRMVGSMSGPISGAIGEGASDVVAFLINGDDRVAEYSASDPVGIRRYPYANYPLTYSAVTGGGVHNDGEIYAAAMYRVLENYLAAGLTANDVLDDFVGGLAITAPGPTYESMRDGMLGAAQDDRACLIWRGFAATGVGVGARATVRGNRVTVTESFALPESCQ